MWEAQKIHPVSNVRDMTALTYEGISRGWIEWPLRALFCMLKHIQVVSNLHDFLQIIHFILINGIRCKSSIKMLF